MPIQVGPLEVIVVLIIALLVFGPQRLPDMARNAGKAVRDFKEAINGSLHDAASGAPRPPGAPATAASALVDPAADRGDDEVLEGIVVRGDAPPGR